MDLVVANARLADRPEERPLDIAVRDGRIAAIGHDLGGEAGETYDAGGRLVCAGLVETHIHLDKSRIAGRCPPPSGRRVNPVTMTAPIKKDFTVEDVRQRAEATLRECLVNGTTRMRTQLEIDPAVELRSFEAVRSLARDYSWAIDLEICVFPQDGMTNYPGTEELLVAALKQGAPVLGAAPRYDSDPAAQIERVFALAREFDVDLDLHLDVGDDPMQMHIYQVLDLTERYNRGGRVVAGHMANLHANVVQIAAPEQLRELFGMLTDRSARLLNLKDYGLAVGNPADLVVIDAETPEQAIAEIRPPLAVWKRGRRTVTRHPPELLDTARAG